MKKYIFLIFFALASVAAVVIFAKPVIASATNCNDTSAWANSNSTEGDDYRRSPFGFFCPRTDGDNYSQVILENAAVTPNGTSSSNRSIEGSEFVAPGQTLNFATGYNKVGNVRTAPPNVTDSRPDNTYYPDPDSSPTNNGVYVWTIVDANDSILDTVGGNSGTFQGLIPKIRSCPTSADPVKAYEGKRKPSTYNGGATTAGFGGNWGWSASDPNRSKFAGDPNEGEVNCGNEGQMIVWALTAEQANSIGTEGLKFNIKLKPGYDTHPTNDKPICLRTMVSIKNNDGADSEAVFDYSKLEHIVAKSKYRCYRMQTTKVEGTVRSSADNATGKLLPNVAVYYDRDCDKTIEKTVYTDADGKYTTNSFIGQLYCIYVRGSDGAPPDIAGAVQDSDGTTYTNPVGIYRSGDGDGLKRSPDPDGVTWQVAGVGCGQNGVQGGNSDNGNYYSECFGRGQDIWGDYEEENSDPNEKGHDFEFNPIPVSPTVRKASFGGDADGNLKPNEEIGFTIEVENGKDANQIVNIRDYIPLNMVSDPNQYEVECIVIDPGGEDDERPADWFVYDDSVDCRSEGYNLIEYAPNYFEYGNDELGTYNREPFIVSKVAGGGASGPYINIGVNKMPAYSLMTIEWKGKTKPANEIGVYPGYTANGDPSQAGDPPSSGDFRYCAAANAGTFNNTTRLMTECEDTNNGYQGVSNFVTTTASGATAYRSNITYNPIPGEITTFTKQVFPATNFGTGDTPAYNIEDPNYNWANFRMDVTPNDALGPVRYRVSDSARGNPLPDPIAEVINIFPDGFSRGTSDANSLAAINWNEQNSAQPGAQKAFSFRVNEFDGDAGVGTTWSNTASACYVEYWKNPHNEVCLDRFADIMRIRMDEPNVAVDYGNVTGGGNISVRDNGVRCNAAVDDDSKGGVVANSRSYGMYMLTVQNNKGYNSLLSKSGFGINGDTPGDGLSCRPDLAKEADDFSPSIAESGNLTFNGDHPLNYSFSSPGVPNSKVVTSSGDVIINSLNVKGRWTLKVDGKVYIRGDIRNSGLVPLSPGSSDSLGIIATQGIYISKDVSRVDAMLYAGGISDSGNPYTPAEIDTCADKDASGNPIRLQRKTNTGGYTAANCRERNLTVNGTMYARTLRLNRTKVSVTDFADRINLGKFGVYQGGQAYLMMPPAFNALLQNGGSGSIREQRPRF